MRGHDFAEDDPSDRTEPDRKGGDKGEDRQPRGDGQVGIQGHGEKERGKRDDGGGEEEYPTRT